MGKLQYQCDVTPDLKDEVGHPVKTNEGVLLELEGILETLQDLFSNEKDVVTVKKGMKKWINYFKKNYQVTDKILSKKFNLNSKDAKKLSEDLYEWIYEIEEFLEKESTVLIKEGKFEDFFAINITKKLTKDIKNDLNDGFEILIHGFPTPAAMIFFRASEAIARRYYEKETGIKNSQLKWSELIRELRNKSHVKRSLLNYLDYLRDKRNESAHPGKTFSQSEGEQILLQVKGLLEDINKK